MPSPVEERNIIKPLINQPLKKDDAWFVVSAKWWNQWKEYTGFDLEELVGGSGGARPNSIHNEPILATVIIAQTKPEGETEPDTTAQADAPPPVEELDPEHIRHGLVADVDYVCVPESVWDNLDNWYSCDYELLRRVCLKGITNQLHIDLYPIDLVIAQVGAGIKAQFAPSADAPPQEMRSQSITLSAASTLKVIRYLMGTIFSCAPHKADVKLLSADGKSIHTLDNLDMTLADYRIHDGAKLYFWQHANTDLSINQGNKINSGSYAVRVLSSEEGTPVVEGVVGLHNLGNTCFMNAALQCFLHTESVRDIMCSGMYQPEINKTNSLGMKGVLIESFAKLFQEYFSNRYTRVCPREFKQAIGTYAPNFVGYNPQDAGELFTFLINGLHEEVKKTERTERGLEDSSVFNSLFSGDFRSTVVCKECENVMTRDEMTYFLPLPLPASNERIVKMVFVPADPSRPIQKIGVKVQKTQTVWHLRAAAAELAGIPLSQAVLIEEERCKALHLWDKKTLLDVRDSDTLYLLESILPLGDGLEVTHVPVAHMKDTSPGYIIPHSTPFVISYPKADILSAEDAFRVIQAYLLRVTKPGAAPVVTINVTVSIPAPEKGTGGNDSPSTADASGGNDADGNTEQQGRKRKGDNTQTRSGGQQSNKPKTRVVDLLELIQEGGAIDPLTQYINIEWEKDSLKKIIENPKPVEHESVKEKIVDENKAIPLNDCMQLFARPEELNDDDQWYCPQCKVLRPVTKTIALQRVPEVLVINLKRFQYSRYKLDVVIDCPLEGLDLTPYLATDSVQAVPPHYDLIAVADHKGTISGGHYTANARVGEQWFHFDDTSTKEIKPEEVINGGAYLLFYQRTDRTLTNQIHTKAQEYEEARKLKEQEAEKTGAPSTSQHPADALTPAPAPSSQQTSATTTTHAQHRPGDLKCPSCSCYFSEMELTSHWGLCEEQKERERAEQASKKPTIAKADSVYVCVECFQEYNSYEKLTAHAQQKGHPLM